MKRQFSVSFYLVFNFFAGDLIVSDNFLISPKFVFLNFSNAFSVDIKVWLSFLFIDFSLFLQDFIFVCRCEIRRSLYLILV